MIDDNSSIDSFTKKPTDDDDNDIVYPVPIDLPNPISTDLTMLISLEPNIYDKYMLHPVSNDLPKLFHPLDDNIYDDEILDSVSNDLPILFRSLSYDEVLTTFNNPEQRASFWCNPSPLYDDDDIVMLNQEMTYVNIYELP